MSHSLSSEALAFVLQAEQDARRAFRVLRETFFNFNALEVLLLHDDEAHIVVRYHMGMPAEEAASYQAMGFFEGLLELAGAKDIRAVFQDKSWEGDERTVLVLRWKPPY